MSAWAVGHWKVLSVAGGLLLSIATMTLGHVNSVDAQFVEIRIEAVRDSAVIDRIERDVSEIKCVVVRQARGEDALSCL